MNWSSLFLLPLVTVALAVEPAAVYDGGFNSTEGTTNSTIELRIGNGGAGQSGLVKGISMMRRQLITSLLSNHIPTLAKSSDYLVLLALADAFIVDSVANGSSPFKVAWITSGE